MNISPQVKFGATYFYHDDNEEAGRTHSRKIARLLNGEVTQFVPDVVPEVSDPYFTFQIKTPNGSPLSQSTRSQFLQELRIVLDYITGLRDQTTKVYTTDLESQIAQAESGDHFKQEARFYIEQD